MTAKATVPATSFFTPTDMSPVDMDGRRSFVFTLTFTIYCDGCQTHRDRRWISP